MFNGERVDCVENSRILQVRIAQCQQGCFYNLLARGLVALCHGMLIKRGVAKPSLSTLNEGVINFLGFVRHSDLLFMQVAAPDVI